METTKRLVGFFVTGFGVGLVLSLQQGCGQLRPSMVSVVKGGSRASAPNADGGTPVEVSRIPLESNATDSSGSELPKMAIGNWVRHRIRLLDSEGRERQQIQEQVITGIDPRSKDWIRRTRFFGVTSGGEVEKFPLRTEEDRIAAQGPYARSSEKLSELCARLGVTADPLEVEVPAGKFRSCVHKSSRGLESRKLWLGEVPLSLVRMEVVQHSHGSQQIVELMEYGYGQLE
jgi:hypothetical protein